jgi:hypothetical protein
LTKNPDTRKTVRIRAEPKDVFHQRNINILGITASEDLRWNENILNTKTSLIKQLNQRVRALSKLVIFTDKAMSKKIANGLFMSKLIYGIQVWGSAPEYLIQKLQVLQNNAARAVLGFRSLRQNQTTLMKNMDWIPVRDLIKYHSAKTIHSAINTGKPEYIVTRLMGHRTGAEQLTRSKAAGKLGPRPANIGATGRSKSTFVARAFEIYNNIPSIITAIKGPKLFSKRLKMYLVNNSNLPSIHDPQFQKLLDPETVQQLIGEDTLEPYRRQGRQQSLP